VKGNGLLVAGGRSLARSGEIDWAQAYEKRMRRFNLAVVLAALAALAILIASFAFSLGNMIDPFHP
jgi:ribosomal protein L4